MTESGIVTAKSLDLRIYTLQGEVKAVSNNIVKFQRQSAEALSLAQKASAMATRLAPLLRIVGIVANILAIVEQVATIQTFAFRIDSVESGQDKHDAELTRQNGLLLSTRKRLAEVEKKTKASTILLLKPEATQRRLYWELMKLHLKSRPLMMTWLKQKLKFGNSKQKPLI